MNLELFQLITEIRYTVNFTLAQYEDALYPIEAITANDLYRIKELTVKYAYLLTDFVDACLVLLGEKLKINEIATVDRDFDIYRLNGNHTFTTYI